MEEEVNHIVLQQVNWIYYFKMKSSKNNKNGNLLNKDIIIKDG